MKNFNLSKKDIRLLLASLEKDTEPNRALKQAIKEFKDGLKDLE